MVFDALVLMVWSGGCRFWLQLHLQVQMLPSCTRFQRDMLACIGVVGHYWRLLLGQVSITPLKLWEDVVATYIDAICVCSHRCVFILVRWIWRASWLRTFHSCWRYTFEANQRAKIGLFGLDIHVLFCRIPFHDSILDSVWGNSNNNSNRPGKVLIGITSIPLLETF